MWKKAGLILILAILINGCGSEFNRDGKISGNFRVKDPAQSGSSDLLTEGYGTLVLEGTGDPRIKLEEPFLKLGKDTPLPDCVVALSPGKEEFDEYTHSYNGTRLYQGPKEGTKVHTGAGGKEGCRGYFSKEEPMVEVEIKAVYVKASKSSSLNYDVEINYQVGGDYKKERWFTLLGEKGWF